MNKRCPRCGRTLPVEEFVRNRSARGGIGAYCRGCHNEIGRQNRTKRWGTVRFYHLKARYGIESDTYEGLWRRQRGLCAICLSEPAAHVDHDHSSGRVRGLLCFRCNGGLGQFGDDPTRFAFAIAYLEQAGEQARTRVPGGDASSAAKES